MFVFDQFTIPIWYTATLNNGFTWTGDLFFPTAPFNPVLVGYRKVGPITWTAMTVTTVR